LPAHSPEEIHALIAAAFNAGDLDALTEVYEEDATLIVPPDGQRVSGREAIRAALESTIALRPSFKSDVVEKLEADGLALTHARWSIVATAGDERVAMAGRGTIVSRRQADGSWRVVLDNPMSPD
jgi:uncharacterized protein (TIGR02246 family)